MTYTIKVLFVCVHNAARSRMAEAILRQIGGTRFEVASAGFEPREVNPLVVEAMALVGLSHGANGPQPSVFQLFTAGRHFHYVIGVCDEEHGQKCPLFPGVTQRIYWSFPDPSSFTGSHEEKLACVIEVRDAIRERIEAWLKALPADPVTTRESAVRRGLIDMQTTGAGLLGKLSFLDRYLTLWIFLAMGFGVGLGFLRL